MEERQVKQEDGKADWRKSVNSKPKTKNTKQNKS